MEQVLLEELSFVFRGLPVELSELSKGNNFGLELVDFSLFFVEDLLDGLGSTGGVLLGEIERVGVVCEFGGLWCEIYVF